MNGVILGQPGRLQVRVVSVECMQPSKILIFTIPFVAIVFLGIGLWMLSTSRGSNEQYADFPVSPGEPTNDPYAVTDSGSYIAIETVAGGVLIRDVRERPEAAPLGMGLFALTSLEGTTSTPFGITFNETDGTFAIGLEAEPLGATRKAAEAYFMSLIGIPPEDACALDVYVGTIGRVNEFYGGKNLGLSFCSGSVPLPE